MRAPRPGYGCPMAVARTEPAASPQFALESLAVEDEHLVVRGRWHGVTGRRFVRPALRVDGRRRVVASLEHKPWTAEEGALWTAAFPHSGDDFATATLEVAPDVTVVLRGESPEAREVGKAKPAQRRPQPEVAALREARDDARRERDDLRSRLEHVTRARDEALEERDAALAEAEAAAARDREEAQAEVRRITAELDSRNHARDAADQRAALAEAALEAARLEVATLREASRQQAAMVERERDAAATEAGRRLGELRRELDRTCAERDEAVAKARRLPAAPPRPAAPPVSAAPPARVARSRSPIELPPDPARGQGARIAAVTLTVPLVLALLVVLRALLF